MAYSILWKLPPEGAASLKLSKNSAEAFMYKFAAAAPHERIVFGAARPGYTVAQINDWIAFMQQQSIQRVCCLLDQQQISRYDNLGDRYREAFGQTQVCWSPIPDFQLCDRLQLVEQILPFLSSADAQGEKVVVHCAGGIGRTGQVLTAWLVSGRGMDNRAAIATVKRTGRNPHEGAIAAALNGKNPWKFMAAFEEVLDSLPGLEIQN
jgi:protein-tyrosine phosphatase